MPIIEIEGKTLKIHQDAFVSAQATIVGDVTIGAGSSIWPGCVVRGDFAPITIGINSTVQDSCVLMAREGFPITIGHSSVIESGCVIYGCYIADYVVIGQGSIIFENATINEGCLVAPRSTVEVNQVIAPRVVVKGIPASTIREMKREDLDIQILKADTYADIFLKLKKWFKHLE